MYSTIVVGTDGSDTAKGAVDVALELARSQDASLHLVTVFRSPASGVSVAMAGSAATADDAVANAVSREAGHQMLEAAAAGIDGVAVETHVVGGTPADALVTLAERIGADLIVVGSKGMRGARRVIGSVPNTVAHSAPCDVLIAKTA